jgi:acyl carrier protein
MQALSLELRNFVIGNFLFGESTGQSAFSDDDSFQALGIIDSMGILELVTYLQEKYQISIADDELIPENLDSVHKVARFVQRKQSEALRVANVG